MIGRTLDTEPMALDRAVALLREALSPIACERVNLVDAAGRVLAETIRADRDSPPVDVSTMDGLANRAADAAAQHRFGARTGGSVIMLGVGKIVFALALGGILLPIVHAYPRSLLAVMVLFAGVTLTKPARESLRDQRSAAIMLATAGVILLVGTLERFLVGCAIAGAIALSSCAGVGAAHEPAPRLHPRGGAEQAFRRR